MHQVQPNIQSQENHQTVDSPGQQKYSKVTFPEEAEHRVVYSELLFRSVHMVLYQITCKDERLWSFENGNGKVISSFLYSSKDTRGPEVCMPKKTKAMYNRT